MTEHSLLRLAETAVRSTGEMLRKLNSDDRRVESTQLGGREVKLAADRRAHEHLVMGLRASGIPVFSEEDVGSHSLDLREAWVIDPLDGSYNFVRSLGHSMVSCALVRDQRAVFGVLYDVLDATSYVGGPDLPSTRDGVRISVAETTTAGAAVLCTGFPARFDFADESEGRRHVGLMQEFAKIRMTGSAAYSLCLVASGSADVYAERSIMAWDVAAGVAVALGAGAKLLTPERLGGEPLDVVVSAASLADEVSGIISA